MFTLCTIQHGIFIVNENILLINISNATIVTNCKFSFCLHNLHKVLLKFPDKISKMITILFHCNISNHYKYCMVFCQMNKRDGCLFFLTQRNFHSRNQTLNFQKDIASTKQKFIPSLLTAQETLVSCIVFWIAASMKRLKMGLLMTYII